MVWPETVRPDMDKRVEGWPTKRGVALYSPKRKVAGPEIGALSGGEATFATLLVCN